MYLRQKGVKLADSVSILTMAEHIDYRNALIDVVNLAIEKDETTIPLFTKMMELVDSLSDRGFTVGFSWNEKEKHFEKEAVGGDKYLQGDGLDPAS